MRVSKRRKRALLHQCFSDFRIASHYGNDLHTYAHLCRRLKIGPPERFRDEAQNNDSADLAFTRRLVSLSARLFLSARWYSF